jgi:hypothetical protein
MKNIKHINEFFHLNEDVKTPEFLNQEKLKELLLNNEDFAKGDVHQALVDLPHDEWDKRKDWNYEDACKWLHSNFGNLALVAFYLAKYNYQIGNGGHQQYFDNGYASSEPKGFGVNYKDIDRHNEFVELFEQLGLNKILPSGKEAFDIISSFELDFSDEYQDCEYCGGSGEEECSGCSGYGSITCEECDGEGEDEEGNTCQNCDGKGEIDCPDCDGRGSNECEECEGTGQGEAEEQLNTESWNRLDSRWYDVDEKLMKEFNDYLKSLTLDGEKISDLIPLADSTQRYKL